MGRVDKNKNSPTKNKKKTQCGAKKQRGTNYFQVSWLQKYNWVKQKSSTHAWCTLCMSKISFENMGEAALISHSKPAKPGKEPTKHQKLVEAKKKAAKSLSVLHFTGNSSQTAEAPMQEEDPQEISMSQSSSSQSSSQSTMDLYVLPVNTVHAEIRWVMKVVLSHFSLRSCLDIKDLFISMFPDSDIAKAFSLSKTKCGYLITFGLAPYFKEELIYEINQSPYYSTLFDESMNRIEQTEQMDVAVRFWDTKQNKVLVRYFDSRFLNRANADNISNGIYTALKGLPFQKCIHLSMDGPTTNWKVYQNIQEKRSDDDLPPMENLGSCGLHSVSGALGTGLKCSSWTLKKVLKSMYNLYHDSPARRDLYMMINSCSTFPKRYCPTRWVENEPVAEVAITLWDNCVNVTNHYLGLAPSKRPKDNSSYNCLVDNKNDVLMKVKMQIFKDIAHQMNMFLVLFQTDNPMVPFLPKVLSTMIRKLMSFIITAPVLEEAVTPLALIKLDVSIAGGKCLPIGYVKLPTAAKSMLKKITLTADKKSSFLTEYRSFLIGTLQKLQERSPLKHSIVRNAAAYDPVQMATEPRSASLMFGGFVDSLFDHDRLTSSEADDAKSQFDEFLDNVVVANKDSFTSFDFKSQRLDEFLTVYLVGVTKYALVYQIFQFVCILSHGQASIERGFNVNKDVIVVHLAKESLVAQRLVYDQVKAYNGKIHEFPITRKLVLSCKSAYSKYQQSLLDKREVAQDNEESCKQKLKQEEVATVKRRRMEVEKAVDSLKAEIEATCIDAGKQENYDSMKLCLDKANAFRAILKEKEIVLSDLGKAIEQLEEELK